MNVWEYFRRLTLGGNKESSKRFIALYTCFLLSFIVLRYTDKLNVTTVIVELIGLILSLLGMAVVENIKGVNDKFVSNQNDHEHTSTNSGE